MKNPKIQVSFDSGILDVKYLDNTIVDTEDIKEIYAFGNIKSKGRKYCIMFEPLGNYDVTEDAVQFMTDNPNNKNIIAKVYILNSKEAETRTKFHFIFDKPELKPQIFKTANEGRRYLTNTLNKIIP